MPAPSSSANPVFPAGSRIGLIPPPGMAPDITVSGFATPQSNAFVSLQDLAADIIEKSFAYEDIALCNFIYKMVKVDVAAIAHRDTIDLNVGRGFLIAGRTTTGGKLWMLLAPDISATVSFVMDQELYTDDVVYATFASVVVHDAPADELARMTPFSLGELAGFHFIRADESGAILGDGPKHRLEFGRQPLLFITRRQGVPNLSLAPDRLASREFALTLPVQLLKARRVTRSEPIPIAGGQGYEIMFEAEHAESGTGLTGVIWLRTIPNGTLAFAGVSPKALWDEALPRFRTVCDGIAP